MVSLKAVQIPIAPFLTRNAHQHWPIALSPTNFFGTESTLFAGNFLLHLTVLWNMVSVIIFIESTPVAKLDWYFKMHFVFSNFQWFLPCVRNLYSPSFKLFSLSSCPFCFRKICSFLRIAVSICLYSSPWLTPFSGEFIRLKWNLRKRKDCKHFWATPWFEWKQYNQC